MPTCQRGRRHKRGWCASHSVCCCYRLESWEERGLPGRGGVSAWVLKDEWLYLASRKKAAFQAECIVWPSKLQVKSLGFSWDSASVEVAVAYIVCQYWCPCLSSGCSNKLPQTAWLTTDTYFSQFWRPGSPRSGVGGFDSWSEPLSWLVDGCRLIVSSHGEERLVKLVALGKRVGLEKRFFYQLVSDQCREYWEDSDPINHSLVQGHNCGACPITVTHTVDLKT